MKLRRALLLLLGLGGTVLGSVVWSARLDYEPEAFLEREMGSRLVAISPRRVTDLSEQCRMATQQGGWLLFVMDAQLLADDRFRTYLETAPEPFGLFVEYDLGTLRLGLGLGPDSDASNAELPIRLVRSSEHATIAIGVTGDETRVVTNAIDKKVKWPGSFSDQWRCDAVQLADDLRESSHGNTCQGCETQLRYAVGRDVSELNAILDDLSNVRRFNFLRVIGSILIIMGLVTVLRQFRAPDSRRE